jgi:hypothetical protein
MEWVAMTINVGTVDRGLRIIVGLAIVGAAVGLYGVNNTTSWGWFGILPLLSGLMGLCPAYSLLGVKTCKA